MHNVSLLVSWNKIPFLYATYIRNHTFVNRFRWWDMVANVDSSIVLIGHVFEAVHNPRGNLNYNTQPFFSDICALNESRCTHKWKYCLTEWLTDFFGHRWDFVSTLGRLPKLKTTLKTSPYSSQETWHIIMEGYCEHNWQARIWGLGVKNFLFGLVLWKICQHKLCTQLWQSCPQKLLWCQKMS